MTETEFGQALPSPKKRCDRDGIWASLTFAPCESKLFVAKAGVSEETETLPNTESAPLTLDSASKPWQVRADEGNCFLLEFARISDGEMWSEPLHTMNLPSKIKNILKSGKAPTLKYEFNIDDGTVLDGLCDVRFVTEAPLPLKVSVNGRSAALREGEWWLDREFSVFDIGAHLKHGSNEVIISDLYDKTETDGGEVMSPRGDFTFGYLVGSFGVFSECPFVTVNNRGLVTVRDR